MGIPTLDGITAKHITTNRLTTRVLFSGPEDGVPVVFVHGNISSATWWEETMVTLPAGYRGIAYDQRGFGDADPACKIDATRGMGDLVDDLVALLDTLNLDSAHVVGSSFGGVVLWHFMIEYPQRIRSVTQVAPGSPYGFGGTHGTDGKPNHDDFAGSGAGLVNPQFAAQIEAGDRGTDSLFSPRHVFKRLWDESFTPQREEEILSALLSTHIGDQDYPGDKVASPNWPGFAPGTWGVNNALSPKYVAHPQRLNTIDPKPSVLWIRGENDQSVSDTALSDYATLGKMGLIPGYPGEDVFPQQPMISQTRAVLETYRASGGNYEEVILEGAGHVPYIEYLDLFNSHFHAHIQTT